MHTPKTRLAPSQRTALRPLGHRPVMARWGLTGDDLSLRALAALELMDAELADLKRRLAEAEHLADRDGLSGLLNHRGFMRALEQVSAYAERYAVAAAVIYLDLDGFKAINDRYGHGAGDAVLRHVGRVLQGAVRSSDHVGRLGGDEFAVILAQASTEEAHSKAQGLAQTLADTPCLYEGVRHTITASAGVHCFRGAIQPERALAAADQAMYAQKHLVKRGIPV